MALNNKLIVSVWLSTLCSLKLSPARQRDESKVVTEKAARSSKRPRPATVVGNVWLHTKKEVLHQTAGMAEASTHPSESTDTGIRILNSTTMASPRALTSSLRGEGGEGGKGGEGGECGGEGSRWSKNQAR